VGAKHRVFSFVTLATIVVLTDLAWAAELVCPGYYSDSAVEVFVSIPLASSPPGGRTFFILGPPTLQDSLRAEQVQVADRTLNALFCGVWPNQIKDGLVVQVGPNRFPIPKNQRSTRKATPTAPTRITAKITTVVATDWIAPTGITFQALKGEDSQENLTVHFMAPSGMQLTIGVLRVRLVSEHSICRGLPVPTPDSARMRIKARVTASLGQDAAPKKYDALFYPNSPPDHCGGPASLDIDFGPFKYQIPSEHQQITLQISRFFELDTAALGVLAKYCSLPYGTCGVSLESNNGRLVFPPATAVMVDGQEANMYPTSFEVYKWQR
jgi:hypothetical protein